MGMARFPTLGMTAPYMRSISGERSLSVKF